MILGGLLGLGLDGKVIETELAKLRLPGVSLEVTSVDRSGISSVHVEVLTDQSRQHRHLSDVKKIIGDSELIEQVKARSILVFTRLAEAEAKVHGITVESVHFHEVGAVDAIVDVVGACVGFEVLGVESFACSALNVGSGFVEMQHGKFPVPPPAVAELLIGVPMYSNEIAGELTTPTGAAIISTVCNNYGSIPHMKVKGTGYGAGTRTYDRFPNVLRLVLGETVEIDTKQEQLYLIETNLDDLSPQVIGYVMERAFEIGALDCWFTAIQMKKNRPGTLASILCDAERRKPLSDLLYSETTTLGLRVRTVERECLDREIVTVHTRYGDIDVKLAYLGGRMTNAMPEYEQVRRIARENDVPFSAVQNEALAELKRNSKAFSA